MLGLVLLNVWLGLAANVDLGSYMGLEWTISGSTITFYYKVASSLKKDDRWVGISFKDANGSKDMKNSDVIIIDFGNLNKIYDMWATRDELPEEDSSNDISEDYSYEVDGDNYVFTFKRSLDTGDSKDYSLADLTEVQIQWAYGDISSSGVLLEHKTEGVVVVYISDGSTVPSSQAYYLLAISSLLFLLV